MLATTLDLVRTALKTDPSVNVRDRTKIMELLRHGADAPKSGPPLPSTPQVLSRSATAQTLDRSLRFVDRLAEEGVLKKVRIPGRRRAIGFAAADVHALITEAGKRREAE